MKKNCHPKRIIILGSTGSIGCNALDIVRNKNKLFKVVALSCHSAVKKLLGQAEEFKPEAVCITGKTAPLPAADCSYRLYKGTEGLTAMIHELKADMVVNGIAGASGLLPSLETIKSHKDLALANKETVVMAGNLLFNLAKKHKTDIIPVDSEHSALFFLTRNHGLNTIAEMILTASGGAVRDMPVEQLHDITPAAVLRHPNWDMGAKITIDSATMANKALEVMEAHHFFKIDIANIKVVIHPQSYVHSLIRTVDGSLYAQISKPDMRIPIQNALTYPELLPVGHGELDIEKCTISFRPVDPTKYPMLSLGINAAVTGGAYPIVFNAANEVAAACFLKSQISFFDITMITEKTLAHNWINLVNSLDDILHIDKQARNKALQLIERRNRT
ncbi:MAG: 1-deoxy-D-xylulose-5-phosphate reductoisomerase [Spirochaetales bacterium]|nr:1-deoxy-D-xylulose-5-phosphate reductoisomerase [Spirochaetales bacterium]